MMTEVTVQHGGETYCVQISDALSALPEAAEIRETVFLEEQGFTVEFDETDALAVHALLTLHGASLATGRAYADAENKKLLHIGRIAVRREHRGKGLGSVVVRALEQYAAAEGYTEAVLSAQVRVKHFYETLGYRAEGAEYLDEFCPHILMRKKLAAE